MSLRDLDEITLGTAIDIISENRNDSFEWDDEATAEDIENF